MSVHSKSIDYLVLKEAFIATYIKRKTEILQNEGIIILQRIREDARLQNLWNLYQKKYLYASNISYEDVIESIQVLLNHIQ